MKVPKFYLETSVFNFVFADDAPDKKADTLKLFQEIKEGKYQPYTSAYVTEELDLAPSEKREKMYQLIADYNIRILQKTEEAKQLAGIYVKEKIIPEKYETDALHISVATVNELDFIVSWNFKHIVKRKTVIMTEAVNIKYDYKKIGIYSPTEVIEYD